MRAMIELKRANHIVGGGVLVLVFVALVVGLLFEAPQIGWLVLLAAAIMLIDVVLTLGVRQWLRDRLGKR
jgi:hypothetical protein